MIVQHHGHRSTPSILLCDWQAGPGVDLTSPCRWVAPLKATGTVAPRVSGRIQSNAALKAVVATGKWDEITAKYPELNGLMVKPGSV